MIPSEAFRRCFRSCSLVFVLFVVFVVLLLAILLDMTEFATPMAGHLVHPTIPLDMGFLTSSTKIWCLVVERTIGIRVLGVGVLPCFGVWLFVLFGVIRSCSVLVG